MKGNKITLDFSDSPNVLQVLRQLAASTKKTQKTIVTEALNAYFSSKLENNLLLKAAETTFEEWDSPEDQIYDDL